MPGEQNMLVTTSFHPTAAEHEQAVSFANRLNARCVSRKQATLPRLRRTYGPQDILVATTQGLKYYASGAGKPYFFHPSTSQIRIKRLMRGETDVLIETAAVRVGDTVLDCTAGLGSDAILFSYAAGPAGQVTALESEPVVALLLEEGLRTYISGLPELDETMRRILVKQVDHGEYLRSLPDRSVDIVYFDPMFRVPIEDAASISPLRQLANDRALSPETVAEACRVARKRVVLKEHRDSGEFERLGFTKQFRQYTKIAYGVIDL